MNSYFLLMRNAGIILLITLSIGLHSPTKAQEAHRKGIVNGSFQMDMQAYQADSIIGINESDLQGKKAGMNAFAKINYTLGDFSAGIRYEAFLKPLTGYDDKWEGQGIANRYISYRKDGLDITLGNFYDQFGSGLIFRSYEEWNLGYDNSMDGVRLRFDPIPGISLKGIYGTQRYYWNTYREESRKRGIVRGIDGEFSLNTLVKKWSESRTQITLGGSFVSKFERDDPSAIAYTMPENVGAMAGRINISRGRLNLGGEYARKINDPTAQNRYIYREGQAALVSASYSQKGFGVVLSAKRVDNFGFKSRRNEVGNALDINYLPAITKQHAYALPGMYPYATQPNGEMGFSGQVIYSIPKRTLLGGRYGTSLSLHYSLVHGIDKQALNDSLSLNQTGTLGYSSEFFKVGKTKYFEDITLEVSRKVSPVLKVMLQYSYLDYNYDVVEEGIEAGHERYKAHVGVLDVTQRLTDKNSLRIELEYLSTRQDSGNWVAAMVEYAIAPTWFFSISDQYNFNNPISNNTYHYYTFALGYIRNTNRISLSYGRQREGIICVGGVCRSVPASSGLTLTISSSF